MISIIITLLMITLVLLSVCQLKLPYLYCLPNHLDKGKSISLLQRVQGCCSLLIFVHDKNLEFTTKLRIATCYLLVLIYYLAVGVYMVHTFYIFTTYSNYLKCLGIRCINVSSSLSSLLSSFFFSLLSPFVIFLSSLFIH